MNNFRLVFQASNQVKLMIQEIDPMQKFDFNQIVSLLLYHLHFHNYVMLLVLHIIIVLEKSALIGIHQVQITLTFIKKNENILDFLFILLPEKLSTIFFLDPNLEIDIGNQHP